MPFQIDKLPDEPIFVITITSPINAQSDVTRVAEAIAEELDKGKYETVYRINDVRQLELSFSDVVWGLAGEARKRPGSASDPHVKSILVGTGAMLKLVSEASKQAQYAGGMHVPLFSTLEEALTYVREQTGQSPAAKP